MASRPRRGTAATLIKKEVKKEEEEEEDVHVIEDNDDVDDDEGPPPLEREASCGENDDTDGETKEGDTESMTDLKEDDGVDVKNGLNLLQALSSVFNTDTDKKKKAVLDAGSVKFLSSTPLPTRSAPIPKALLLKKNSNSMPSTSSSNRLTNLRPMNPNESRKYGVPPPIPQALRNIAASISTAPTIVGSNTSLGPARLLENRKRPNSRDSDAGSSKRASGLVAYNGGRAGEKFQNNVPTTSSKSSGTATSSATFDVSSFLRNQSPVQMQVSVGGEQDNGDSMQEAFEMAVVQKETIGNIAKASTNQSILLGSLVLNGLNTLQNRSSEEYNSFVGDLFSLITKYKIQ